MSLNAYYEPVGSFSAPEVFRLGKFNTYLSALREMGFKDSMMETITLKERFVISVLSVKDFGRDIPYQRTTYDMYIDGNLEAIVTFGP